MLRLPATRRLQAATEGPATVRGRGPGPRARGSLLLTAAVVVGAGAGTAAAVFSSTTSLPESSFSSAVAYCSASNSTLAASSDSYVSNTNSTTNYGTSANAIVDADPTKTRRAYVSFTLPAAPSGCTLASATLSLTLSTTGGAVGRTHNVFRAASTWTETGITWSNQPGSTGTAVSATVASGVMSWTVTSQVAAHYSGTNTGFLIVDSAEGTTTSAATYTSREGKAADVPTLTLTWS